MDYKERFFINNYTFFGESTRRRCKYKKEEAQNIKKKYKKKGVYFLPIKDFGKTNMPVKKERKEEDSFSGVQFAVASLREQDQNKILELAKNIPSPETLINHTIAIQNYRIKMGLQNEYDQGRILDTTETAINNYVNMIQVKNNIEEGQEVNVNINNSISAILEEIDEDENDDEITIDVDKNKKISDYIE